jgi:hypothetical protein
MGQQSQVVMNINQALSPAYIQPVSFDAMDEIVDAPTPLCRRSVHHLLMHPCCQTLQLWGSTTMHVPPLKRTQIPSISNCMVGPKGTIAKDVMAQLSPYVATLLIQDQFF